MANHPPVVTANNISVVVGQSVAASTMVASVSDQDGNSITQYAFWDGGSGGGYFTLNGTAQVSGQWITVSAANLGTVRYVGGLTAGTETLYVDVYDGTDWSAYASLTATTAVPNHAPVVTVHDVTVAAGQAIAASSVITSVTDQDGDSITQYSFWDGGSGGGYLTVNGAVQVSGQWITVTAANLSSVKYVGGSAAGSETLYVDVYDGKDWSAYTSLTATTTGAAVNHAPVVTAKDISVAASQSVAASTLIASVSDQDGDSITQYAFWDGGSSGGYFTVNGTAQASGQWITVTAANLSTVKYVGGAAAGSETLYVDVYDGKDWSTYAPLAATTTAAAVNHAPIVVVHDISVAVGQSVTAGSMISSVQDQDGDAISQYAFWDGGSGGGYFTVNGTAQASGQWITVTAANLGTVKYVGGSTAGSESLFVDVYDGKDWSAYVPLTATTTSSANHAPVLTVHNVSVAAGQSLAASSVITSIVDQDGDAISQYAFWDGGGSGGYFTVNGTAQASGQWITVSAANLGTVKYVGGSTAGSEALYVDVYDGKDWSAISSLTATTINGQSLPVITVKNQSVNANASIQAASVVVSVSDPANNPITYYDFRDNGSGGGHFSLNGVTQASGVWITVSASDLPTLTYVGGSAAGSETVDVAAWDGVAWSYYQTATITTATPVNVPVLTVQNQAVDINASIAASSFISKVVDPNNLAITAYQFRDNGSGGGHFALNGLTQASGTWLTVNASDLAKLTYVGGSTAGAETVDVAAYDGQAWSYYQTALATTRDAHPPVVYVQSQAVNVNGAIQASTLIADVLDPNNLAITSYKFFDEGAAGGHLALNGVAQASGTWITVSATDLSKLTYVGGPVGGSETVDIAVFDGLVWSAAASTSVITNASGGNPPVITVQNQSVNQNQAIQAGLLIASVSDPDNDSISFYEFRDNGAAGGHLLLNNITQASGTWVVVSSADLSKLLYVGGSTPGSETVDVAAFDGKNWSAFKSATVTTTSSQASGPVITVHDQKVDQNATIAASSLIVSVTDPNHLAITAYDFRDNNAGGGYFSLNGVAQTSGAWITVSTSDLSKLTYVGGAAAGAESVDIAASNGFAWSNYQTAIITTTASSGLPVLTVTDQTVDQNAAIQAASLIVSINDPNNFAITTYQFQDNGAGGGHFSLNGVTQASGAPIQVSAADLSKLTYVGGTTAGSETVNVAVWDGHNWSDVKTATITTKPSATNPVIALLHDANIIADVTANLSNNALGYAGMLKILNDVAASGVTSTEFTDLKTLVANFNKTNGITVSAYLYDISNSLINGNVANAHWTGGLATSVALGNLTAGSSQDQMLKLVSKWFLGADLPSIASAAAYRHDTNPLFDSTGQPSIHDINQGQLGDCYLEASMMVTAVCDPSIIQSMFINNGNGTYGVRFFVNGKATYVTVNDQLPFYGNSTTQLYYNNSTHIWASLIEKAYVELNEQGALSQPAGNAYANIDGGWAEPITFITNKSLTSYNSGSYTLTNWNALKQTIVNALQNHQEVDFASFGGTTIGGLQGFVSAHMFGTLSYDTATGNFVVRNPWGDQASGSAVIQFEATMSDLFNMHGYLFVANGGTGVAPGATSSNGSVGFVLNAFQNGSWTSPIAVSDNAMAVQTNIDNLQDASSLVASIQLTDGGIPTIALTAAQSVRDHGVISDIQSPFSLYVTSTTDANTLIGGPSSDTFIGNDGADRIQGAAGNDSIDGGGGINTAVYSGARSQYTLTATGNGSLSVADTVSNRDGTDSLTHIDRLEFSDGMVITTWGSVKAAHLGVLRTASFDSEAAAAAGGLDNGTLTFGNYTQGLISQAQSSTVPALVTYDFFFGKTPASGGLDFLTNFTNIIQTPAGGGFSVVNTFVNLAATDAINPSSNFAASYGVATIPSEQVFFNNAYSALFGHAPSQGAIDNYFHMQTFNLPNGSTIVGSTFDFYREYVRESLPATQQTATNLENGARGAVVGTLLFFAEADPTTQYAQATTHFLQDAAIETPAYQVSLIGTYLASSTPHFS